MFEEALVVGAGVLLLVAIVTLVLVIAARGRATGGARPVRRYPARTDSDSVMFGSSEAMQDGRHHHQGGGHHDVGGHHGGGHYGGDGGGGHHGG